VPMHETRSLGAPSSREKPNPESAGYPKPLRPPGREPQSTTQSTLRTDGNTACDPTFACTQSRRLVPGRRARRRSVILAYRRSPQRERRRSCLSVRSCPSNERGRLRYPILACGQNYSRPETASPDPAARRSHCALSFATTSLGWACTSLLQPLQQSRNVLPSAVTLMGTSIEPRCSPETGQTI
jgi:hypothetical protein